MSWDIVLFSSRKKINSIEEVEEPHLIPIDFCEILDNNFIEIIKNKNHREIKGKDFSVDYFIDEGKVSNKTLNLYGENGLFEIVLLARKYNWQIFDTALGEMIDLENPSKNGYENFQSYFKLIIQNEF